MTRKILICYLFTITLTTGIVLTSDGFAQDAEDSVAPLSDEDRRFDFDGDGRLGEDEKEIMLETITQEAFAGVKLDERAIREMRRGGGPRGFRGRGGFGRGRGPRRAEKVVHRFDKDGDGKLNESERGEAREDLRDGREAPRVSRSSDETLAKTTLEDDLKASKAVATEDNVGLYDNNTLRTFYLRFYDEDWYEQLGDFYRTDVDVPADLIVDGKVYRSVGLRFRGSSSYFTVENEKKSFNITVDADDENQRLFGYKTLNLLNGHSDASFLREVLYSRIARNYIHALRANFVKLLLTERTGESILTANNSTRIFFRNGLTPEEVFGGRYHPVVEVGWSTTATTPRIIRSPTNSRRMRRMSPMRGMT